MKANTKSYSSDAATTENCTKYKQPMILLYNVLLIVAIVLDLPILTIKILINRRFRYRFTDRIFPKPVKIDNYFLVHASSFGEIRTILSIVDKFKKELKLKPVLSVFTDTAHKFLKDKDRFLMPLDLVPLYKRIFKKSPPKLAIFFESELWPSYIYVLKKFGTKLVLLNARMSEKSFNSYKRFKPLFGRTINSFNLIIAKSKEDAKRYRYFNRNTIVCGNLKFCTAVQSLSKEKKQREGFLIDGAKQILVLASFHKEEITLAIELIKKLKGKYTVVLAPRHLEDVNLFEQQLKKNNITYAKRTSKKRTDTCLLLDTLGELTGIYSISDYAIVGGSFNKKLKGHNPMEPVFFSNVTICGPYMESFKEEVEFLKKHKLIYQLKSSQNTTEEILYTLKSANKENVNELFSSLSYILNCHLFNTIKLIKTQ